MSKRYTMAKRWTFAVLLLVICTPSECSHFRGAMIYWKQSTIAKGVIDVDYRQSWTRSQVRCDDNMIANGTLISQGNLGIANNISFTSGSNDITELFAFQCTDYSIQEDWTSGKGHINFLPSAIDNSTKIFFVTGGAWKDNIIGMNDSSWSLLAVINTTERADTGRINQSPRVDMPPVVHLQHGCSHTIRIPVTDEDDDDIRCRWARSRPGYDECAGVCNLFYNAVINERDCTITYDAHYTAGYYAVAVQIEDFSSPTSNTALSSIPLQFVVVVENQTSCATFQRLRPTFEPPTSLTDEDCIGVRNGTEFSADIYLNSHSNSSISELNTISPIGLVKSSLEKVHNRSATWHIRLTWNPNKTDTVNNILCVTAVDSNGMSSEQRCVTLLAEVSPAKILPHSKSPSSFEVPISQHHWLIEFDDFASPSTRPAFIYLYSTDEMLLETIDVSTSENVTFTTGRQGTKLQFSTATSLQPGQEYYFLFGQGLVHGNIYCGVGSSAELNSSFWKFTVLEDGVYMNESSHIDLYAGIAAGVMVFIFAVIATGCCLYKAIAMRRYKTSKRGYSEELISNDSTISTEIFAGSSSNHLTPIVIPKSYMLTKVELLNQVESKRISGKTSFNVSSLVPHVKPNMSARVEPLYQITPKTMCTKLTFDASLFTSDVRVNL